MIRHQMTLTADSAASMTWLQNICAPGVWFLYEGRPHMLLGISTEPHMWRALRYDPGTGNLQGEVELRCSWNVIPLSHHITLEPAEYP